MVRGGGGEVQDGEEQGGGGQDGEDLDAGEQGGRVPDGEDHNGGGDQAGMGFCKRKAETNISCCDFVFLPFNMHNEIYKQLILKNIWFIGRVAEVARTAFTEKFGLGRKF